MSQAYVDGLLSEFVKQGFIDKDTSISVMDHLTKSGKINNIKPMRKEAQLQAIPWIARLLGRKAVQTAATKVAPNIIGQQALRSSLAASGQKAKGLSGIFGKPLTAPGEAALSEARGVSGFTGPQSSATSPSFVSRIKSLLGGAPESSAFTPSRIAAQSAGETTRNVMNPANLANNIPIHDTGMLRKYNPKSRYGIKTPEVTQSQANVNGMFVGGNPNPHAAISKNPNLLRQEPRMPKVKPPVVEPPIGAPVVPGATVPPGLSRIDSDIKNFKLPDLTRPPITGAGAASSGVATGNTTTKSTNVGKGNFRRGLLGRLWRKGEGQILPAAGFGAAFGIGTGLMSRDDRT